MKQYQEKLKGFSLLLPCLIFVSMARIGTWKHNVQEFLIKKGIPKWKRQKIFTFILGKLFRSSNRENYNSK